MLYVVCPGPEAGLTRDPTAAWLHHGGLQVSQTHTRHDVHGVAQVQALAGVKEG
jgi:hypothetical protein